MAPSFGTAVITQTSHARPTLVTEDVKSFSKGSLRNPNTKPSTATVLGMRLLLLSVAALVYKNYDRLQGWTNYSWVYLCNTWVYNCVYFETWWVTVCYSLIIGFPYVVAKLGMLQRYKIDPTLEWQSAGLRIIILEAVAYCAPLMLLDTFTVKKYVGVDPLEWESRSSQGYIQHTRALPVAPPSVLQVLYQLAVSFLLYDIMFFAVHLTLHRNLWLYKTLHAKHHDHNLVHARVTNQLTVTERLVLVLSANQALKFVYAHPFTRTLFVPLFICMLVENHCGYDLPFTLDKVVPFGFFGGSAYHFKHHTHGSRNYQPFFTYADRLLDLYASWNKSDNRKLMD